MRPKRLRPGGEALKISIAIAAAVGLMLGSGALAAKTRAKPSTAPDAGSPAEVAPAAVDPAVPPTPEPVVPAAPPPKGLIRPQPINKGDYGESFTFLGDLSDGSYVWMQFAITNIGPGSDHGICRASVTGPDGSNWKADVRVKPGDKQDEWRYDKDREALHIARCVATEGQNPEIKAVFDEGSVTLKFAQPLRPLTVEGTEFKIDNYVYRIKVLQPYSPVTAELKLNGSPARRLEGGGYVDHAYTAVPPSKIAKQWIRFRALGSAPMVLLAREAQEGGFVPAFRWTPDEGAKPFTRFEVQRSGKNESTAWRIKISDSNPKAGPDASATLRSAKFLSRRSFIQDLGFLGKMVKPFVGSPVTYTHRAVLEREGKKPVEGILEVSLEEG